MIHVPFACVFRRYPRGRNSCYSQDIVGRLLLRYSSANREFAKIVATSNKKRCKFQEVPNTLPKNPGAAYLLSRSKIKCIYSLYTENTCLTQEFPVLRVAVAGGVEMVEALAPIHRSGNPQLKQLSWGC